MTRLTVALLCLAFLAGPLAAAAQPAAKVPRIAYSLAAAPFRQPQDSQGVWASRHAAVLSLADEVIE